MSDEGVWIKLKVPVALHGELRTRAFHVGEKLGKYVEGILDSYCTIAKVGGIGPKIEQKQTKVKPEPQALETPTPAPATPPKPVVPQSKAIGGVAVGPLITRVPVGDDEVPVMKCNGCGEKVTKWTCDKLGRPWCQDCVENQKNNQQ